MVVQLRSCCCGCTLRTGTIIIAILGVLGGVSIIVEGIFQTDATGNPTNSTTIMPIVHPTLIPVFNIPENGTAIDDVVPGQHGFNVTRTIYGFLETIICALLLVGAIKNSAKLIFPWIVVSVILVILEIIIFFGLGILLCVATQVSIGLGYLIFGAIYTAFSVYFILVVNSFHTTLKSGQVSRA